MPLPRPLRRSNATKVVATVLCVVSGPLYAASAPIAGSFRDGLWEMTIRTDVPGVQSMPPMNLKRCISAKEIQDLQAKASQPPGSEQCKVLEQKASGNTTSWKIECTGKTKIKGEGSVTASGDTYSMQSVIAMVTPEGKAMEIKSNMSGKRLGDCKS
ncbi:MAG: DUF3617 family protein [Proteobacteria bacterium]|nr:DUF3617 family protein [Burkholderiales bacterium]